jgi:DNA-binding transcriptional LysR family regulator
MITDAAISCFLSLAETLSFTETANRLYMTQQGVSKIIASLEEELGTPSL